MASLNKTILCNKVGRFLTDNVQKGVFENEFADTVLKFIEKTLNNVETIDDLGVYCAMLGYRFPELKPVVDGLRMNENEKLDTLIPVVVDKILETHGVEVIEDMFQKITDATSVENKIEIVKKLFPEEYKAVYEKTFKI